MKITNWSGFEVKQHREGESERKSEAFEKADDKKNGNRVEDS